MSRFDEMLAGARATIVRYSPAEAWAAEDVLLVHDASAAEAGLSVQ